MVVRTIASMVVAVALALPAGAQTVCGDQSARADAFAFRISKPDDVRKGEIVIKRGALGESFRFTSRVSDKTEVEKRGWKRSQRSEIAETPDTSARTDTGAWTCYAWTMALPDDLAIPNPRPGRNEANLTLAQFHQDAAPNAGAPAVLFLNVESNGSLVAEFNEPVGKRTRVLIPGGKNGRALEGRTWDMLVAVKWSTSRSGRTQFWLREHGAAHYMLVAEVPGRNATASRVYQKLGIYRHFIERDKALAKATIEVDYSDIRRNGHPARFVRR